MLERLCLSENCLGDVCSPMLARCISNLRQLATLQVSSCNLSADLFSQPLTAIADAFQRMLVLVLFEFVSAFLLFYFFILFFFFLSFCRYFTLLITSDRAFVRGTVQFSVTDLFIYLFVYLFIVYSFIHSITKWFFCLILCFLPVYKYLCWKLVDQDFIVKTPKEPSTCCITLWRESGVDNVLHAFYGGEGTVLINAI